MNRWTVRDLCLSVAAVVALSAGAAHAQGDASTANALIRDLKNPDFDTAYGATEQLRKYPQYRAQVVAGLIDAITTGNGHFLLNLWRRSLADRDSLLRSLRGLGGKRSSGQQAPGRHASAASLSYHLPVFSWRERIFSSATQEAR